MATGDIQIIENKNGRAKFPVTHFRAVFNDDGENLEEFLADYTGGGSNLTGYVAVDSVANLPDPGVATLGYLIGTDLYLYVGTGGDTLDGKYQDCGPFRGPKGEDGPPGADGTNGLSADNVSPVEDVEEGLAAVVLRKTQQTLTPQEKAQVKLNLDIPDTVTTDATPTQNSTNPVQSGGVFSALAGKTDPTPVADSQPEGGMLPNVFYDFGVLASNTTFALDTVNVEANVLNHYFWQFSIGSTVPTITFPSDITAWCGGGAPTISANMMYQISVIDGLAVAAEF